MSRLPEKTRRTMHFGTDTNDAFSLMKRAMTIEDQMIGQVFSVGSESRRSAYVNKLEGNCECFLSLVWQHLQDSPEAARLALELVLRRKAIGAEALAVQRDAVLGGQYPHLEPELRRLTALRMQIAQKTLAGPGPEGLPEHNRLLAEWNGEKERLEGNLARQIPEMNLQRKLHAADRRAVALSLDEGTALIEFIRFHEFDFRAVAERINETEWLPLQTRKPARYLAFILFAGQPDNVRMVDLGEAEPIDQMIADFRAGFTDEPERLRGMVAVSQYQQPLAAADGGSRLRKAVFDRVVEAVDGRTRLFLALDGDLTRLPFETLPTDDGRRLIDGYKISYLSVGRDILRFTAPTTGKPADPMVIADPDFDLAANGVACVSDAGDTGCHSAGTSGYVAKLYDRRISREFESGQYHFHRLPGTRREGWEIATMLRVQPRLADTALEAPLKQCRSPQILHVATHGFFFPNRSYDPERESRGRRAPAEPVRLARQGLKNPLLRSGLALSGANTWLAGGSLPPEAEDGLLTAEGTGSHPGKQ